MGILPAIIFFGLLTTFIMSLLLTMFNDEMSDFFYLVFDSVMHQLGNITQLVRR